MEDYGNVRRLTDSCAWSRIDRTLPDPYLRWFPQHGRCCRSDL